MQDKVSHEKVNRVVYNQSGLFLNRVVYFSWNEKWLNVKLRTNETQNNCYTLNCFESIQIKINKSIYMTWSRSTLTTSTWLDLDLHWLNLHDLI